MLRDSLVAGVTAAMQHRVLHQAADIFVLILILIFATAGTLLSLIRLTRDETDRRFSAACLVCSLLGPLIAVLF